MKFKLGILIFIISILVMLVLGCSNSKVTVEFLINGGIGEDTTIVLDSGQKVHSPIPPTIEGKYFVGWYTSDQCLENEFFDCTQTPINNNLKLYAKYDYYKFNVDFQFPLDTEGVWHIDSQQVAYGSKVIFGNTLRMGNLALVGFYKDEEFTTPWNSEDVVTQNLTLYAKTELIVQLTLDYNYNNSPKSVIELTKNTSPNNVAFATRQGYLLEGWYTSQTKFDISTKYDFDTKVAQDTTIFANWIKTTSKNNFDYYVVDEYGNKPIGTVQDEDSIYKYIAISQVINCDSSQVVIPASIDSKIVRFLVAPPRNTKIYGITSFILPNSESIVIDYRFFDAYQDLVSINSSYGGSLFTINNIVMNRVNSNSVNTVYIGKGVTGIVEIPSTVNFNKIQTKNRLNIDGIILNVYSSNVEEFFILKSDSTGGYINFYLKDMNLLTKYRHNHNYHFSRFILIENN